MQRYDVLAFWSWICVPGPAYCAADAVDARKIDLSPMGCPDVEGSALYADG